MSVRALSLVTAAVLAALSPIACDSFSASDDASTPPPGAAGGDANGSDANGGADGTATGDASTPTTITLASGYGLLRGVAATDTDVFFIDQSGNGGVFTVPIVGGTVTTISPHAGPSSLAVHGSYVYWTDVAAGTVNRAPVSGGSSIKAAASPASTPVTMAVGAGTLAVLASGSTNSIKQFDLDLVAQPAATVSAQAPFEVTAFGANIYWTEGGPSNYVASAQAGSSTRTALYAETDAEMITSDDAGVYWTIPSAKKIRASLNGGFPVTLATEAQAPQSIACDGTYVYWTTSNEVRRTGHMANGTSSLVASGFTSPPTGSGHARALAVTSDYVVWITSDGRVLARNKL